MAPRGVHYLTQAVDGGLGAKKACNWSNSALIDVKNPPSSWFEKQCLHEMLQDQEKHFFFFCSFFFIFYLFKSSFLNVCTTVQTPQPSISALVPQ